MDRVRRAGIAMLLLCLVLTAGCERQRVRQGEQPSAPQTSKVSALASDSMDARPAIAVEIASVHERARIETALKDAGYPLTHSPADAAVVLADRPLSDADPLVLALWVAATDQRRDVFELRRSDVRAILAGSVTDWQDLGGTAQPLAPYLASEDVERAALAFDIPARVLRSNVIVLEREAIAPTVAARPGAFALLPVSELRPGLLALVVNNHDPYRDEVRASPLRLERWVAGSGIQGGDVLRTVGWSRNVERLDPVGVLATGDIIPVRCSNSASEAGGGAGRMFDGTRHLLRAADLVVAPLDAGLTDRSRPTPCEPSFVLSAQTALAAAMAEAGIDVVVTATNHHMDCYERCSPVDVHEDTLAALAAAGLKQVGSGASLEDARDPLIIERAGVRFAILAYDEIAYWSFATDEIPGTAPLSWETLESLGEDVATAREQADHVIVAFSWGVEYITAPTDLQREAARIAAEAGASLIVGNHPHAVQASEVIATAPVLYALGNFVFDQDWSPETMEGVVLEVGFTRERVLGMRLRPIAIRERHRPEFVDPALEGRTTLRRLWDASDLLATQ